MLIRSREHPRIGLSTAAATSHQGADPVSLLGLKEAVAFGVSTLFGTKSQLVWFSSMREPHVSCARELFLYNTSFKGLSINTQVVVDLCQAGQ